MVFSENDVKKVVAEVVAKYLSGESPRVKSGGKIPLEVSARHVHLTKEAFTALFGERATLGKKRDLSQPGEFLSDKRVTLVSEKGTLTNVAVLGPFRRHVQVELSATDCKGLKLSAPVNVSGNLTGAPDVKIVGECGEITAKNSVIIAKAHIHLTTEDARRRNLKDGQIVAVAIVSKRPATLNSVEVRVNDNYKEACHIDFDEANACMVDDDTTAEILV